MPTDQQLKNGLNAIIKRRRNLHIGFAIVFIAVIVLKYFEAPNFIAFLIIAAGIIVLFPMFRCLSLSTCPRCHNNYYGVIANINKTKCSSYGLELNYKAAVKDEREKT